MTPPAKSKFLSEMQVELTLTGASIHCASGEYTRLEAGPVYSIVKAEDTWQPKDAPPNPYLVPVAFENNPDYQNLRGGNTPGECTRGTLVVTIKSSPYDNKMLPPRGTGDPSDQEKSLFDNQRNHGGLTAKPGPGWNPGKTQTIKFTWNCKGEIEYSTTPNLPTQGGREGRDRTGDRDIPRKK